MKAIDLKQKLEFAHIHIVVPPKFWGIQFFNSKRLKCVDEFWDTDFFLSVYYFGLSAVPRIAVVLQSGINAPQIFKKIQKIIILLSNKRSRSTVCSSSVAVSGCPRETAMPGWKNISDQLPERSGSRHHGGPIEAPVHHRCNTALVFCWHLDTPYVGRLIKLRRSGIYFFKPVLFLKLPPCSRRTRRFYNYFKPS